MKQLRDAFIARYRRYAQPGIRELELERRWKFETLFFVAQASSRQLVHDHFVPNMQSDGNIAIQILQLLAQPISRSGEIIPTPGDLEARDLDTLSLLVDVDEMAKIVLGTWVKEGRQKGPEHWSSMKPDDRTLSQFWYLHTQRPTSRSDGTEQSNT